MNKITKKVEQVDDVCIKFTDEELKALGLEKGEKFSVKTDGNKIILTPYAKLELDLNDFDRKTLEALIKESCEKDISINEVIENILRSCIGE